MRQQLTMHAIKRPLCLFMVAIILFGCTPLTGLSDSPSVTPPSATFAQPLNPTTIEAPPVTTSMLDSTPTASLGINSVTPQPSGVATLLSANVTQSACQPDLVTQPPWPDKILQPNELDQETGLHMTGRPQQIDLVSYRLQVTGLVDHVLNLTYHELRCMPNVTDNPVLICPGVFSDNATWTGVQIKVLLELAGVQPGATQLTLVSADGYEVNLPLDTASKDENFLAYEVNGKTLPVQHGFPLRAVIPSMWGSYWLKWLVEIKIS